MYKHWRGGGVWVGLFSLWLDFHSVLPLNSSAVRGQAVSDTTAVPDPFTGLCRLLLGTVRGCMGDEHILLREGSHSMKVSDLHCHDFAQNLVSPNLGLNQLLGLILVDYGTFLVLNSSRNYESVGTTKGGALLYFSTLQLWAALRGLVSSSTSNFH